MNEEEAREVAQFIRARTWLLVIAVILSLSFGAWTGFKAGKQAADAWWQHYCYESAQR